MQGEGIHVGVPTLFVRFGGCDLRCRWCDSPHTWKPVPRCRMERSRGSAGFEEVPNPVSVADLMSAAEALELDAHRFVSLTGGEPLLQPQAVRALGEALHPRPPRLYLETHGLAVEALEGVVDRVDVVSMDWKLASDVREEAVPFREPGRDFHADHERFLRVALAAPEVFVKVVVTRSSLDAELAEVGARIAAVNPDVPLIVQPVTPRGPVKDAPDPRFLLDLVAALSRTLNDVRLVPQTHKSTGIL